MSLWRLPWIPWKWNLRSSSLQPRMHYFWRHGTALPPALCSSSYVALGQTWVVFSGVGILPKKRGMSTQKSEGVGRGIHEINGSFDSLGWFFFDVKKVEGEPFFFCPRPFWRRGSSLPPVWHCPSLGFIWMQMSKAAEAASTSEWRKVRRDEVDKSFLEICWGFGSWELGVTRCYNTVLDWYWY